MSQTISGLGFKPEGIYFNWIADICDVVLWAIEKKQNVPEIVFCFNEQRDELIVCERRIIQYDLQKKSFDKELLK